MNLKESIKKHEGLELKPYRCSAGKLTIGWGRNLQDRGVTRAEAEAMLDLDILEARTAADRFKWFWLLDRLRQDVVVEMVFNLGLPKFLGFKKMIQALREQDYEEARVQMLDSKWANQVGQRAITLADKMWGENVDS